MMRGLRTATCLFLLPVFVASAARAEERNADDKSKKPPAVEVAASTLVVPVELEGVIVAENMAPVSLRPDVWKEMIVVEALPHGSRVSKGDRLVRLDLADLDRKIEELQAERAAAEMGLRRAEVDLDLLEKNQALAMARAERADRIVSEDLERYTSTELPMAEKSADRSLMSAEFSLEYAEEELRQLEKMYEADDLTEETEEIILTRQRRSVDAARFRLENSRLQHERVKKMGLPRELEGKKQQVQQENLDLERTRAIQPLDLLKQQLELQAARRRLDAATRKLREHEHDRDLLADVTAPASGILYYGACQDGRWPSAADLGKRMVEGGKLPAGEAFATIVSQRPVYVQATVSEAQLRDVKPGSQGQATMTGLPEPPLPAVVESVTAIPVAQGRFDARISISVDAGWEALVPGMTCKVVLEGYRNDQALTVPATAVKRDPSTGDPRPFVFVVGTREPQKRFIQAGREAGGRVEVLDGLSAGEKVLKKAPSE